MQRLLLDTHAFVWWLTDASKLTKGARAAIASPHNDIFVSAITGWEIAVKRARGRMRAPDNLSAIIEEWGFTHLPLTFRSRGTGGESPDASPGSVRPAPGCPGPGRRACPGHRRCPHSSLRRPYAGGVKRRRCGPAAARKTDRGKMAVREGFVTSSIGVLIGSNGKVCPWNRRICRSSIFSPGNLHPGYRSNSTSQHHTTLTTTIAPIVFSLIRSTKSTGSFSGLLLRLLRAWSR